jgi:spore germination cell wall hydrolase CwlJ-like protein
MHPVFFLGTWIVSLLIIVSSFSVSNIYHLPVNIAFDSLTDPVKKQIECLAENIYFEARNEPDKGKVAVAMVTMNRVATGNYANTVCDVVYQRTRNTENKIVCQFSWTCQAKEMSERLTIRKTSLYNDIRNMSVRVYMNYDKIQDVTKGATYYHADYVSPGWGLPVSIKIGRHIFYTKKTDLNNLSREV